MNFDFSDFSKGLKDFIAFFTVKHITVLVFVVLCLVLICQPHQMDGSAIGQNCSDASCPFPRKDAQVQRETVAQENWSFVLPGIWEDHEPTIPEIKTVRFNPDTGCMILLIKEASGSLSLAAYTEESIQGFKQKGVAFSVTKPLVLGKWPFVFLEGSLKSDVIQSWNTTKGGFGYSFNCFCHSPQGICKEVANTLEIK